MKKKLEICCYTVESAIIAEKAGADRIELCDNFSEGGTTPSYAAIAKAVELLKIPVNVIVRPRGGDFHYSNLEFEIIKQDVQQIKQLKANGIVVGFLNADGSIDIQKTKEIAELAKPMELTFHRAFDMCNDPFVAMEQLIEIGVKRILTSGQKDKAPDGAEMISELVKKANNHIIIMPGSGVNETNIVHLINTTGATEFHTSAKAFSPSLMEYYNDDISMGGNSEVDEYGKVSVNENVIKGIIKAIKNFE